METLALGGGIQSFGTQSLRYSTIAWFLVGILAQKHYQTHETTTLEAPGGHSLCTCYLDLSFHVEFQSANCSCLRVEEGDLPGFDELPGQLSRPPQT